MGIEFAESAWPETIQKLHRDFSIVNRKSSISIAEAAKQIEAPGWIDENIEPCAASKPLPCIPCGNRNLLGVFLS